MRVGDNVTFGRKRGATAFGRIIRVSQKTATVELTAQYNSNPPGVKFRVPFSMLKMASNVGPGENSLRGKEAPEPTNNPVKPYALWPVGLTIVGSKNFGDTTMLQLSDGSFVGISEYDKNKMNI